MFGSKVPLTVAVCSRVKVPNGVWRTPNNKRFMFHLRSPFLESCPSFSLIPNRPARMDQYQVLYCNVDRLFREPTAIVPVGKREGFTQQKATAGYMLEWLLLNTWDYGIAQRSMNKRPACALPAILR